MILVDTSIWIDHLNRGDRMLARLLAQKVACLHSFVLGEIALGSLRNREAVMTELEELPRVLEVDNEEIMFFIAHHNLGGSGIGYVDAHLLASAAVTSSSTRIWTRDRRLAAQAERLSLLHVAPAG